MKSPSVFIVQGMLILDVFCSFSAVNDGVENSFAGLKKKKKKPVRMGKLFHVTFKTALLVE